MWEYDVGYIPVTPRENEYLKLRDKLDLGARADRYLDGFSDLDAGGTIIDAWPREPYLRLYLTRDLSRHLAALKRLARYPDNLRVQRVRHSWADLKRAQDRVGRDEAKLRRAGFHVVSSGLSPSANRVEVDVITKRKDGGRYFRKRYGPVRVLVTATEPTRLSCAGANGFEITPTGLTLRWETTDGHKLERVELIEHPDRVEVGVVERVRNGPTNDISIEAHAEVKLAAPLGDRAVIDVSSGARLVQRGPAPGEPACTRQQLSEAEQNNRQRAKDGLPPGGDTTPAEQRWLERRQKLTERVERDLYSYLSRFPDVVGGVRIEGTFPGPMRYVFGFTRDIERHEAELRRRTKLPFRVEQIAHAEAELRDLAERIQKDANAASGFLDGYGRAGFFVFNPEVETDQTVTVTLITARPDHAAYFAARYGPLVRTLVVGDRFECVGTE